MAHLPTLPFTLSRKVTDILNQEKSLKRTTSAEYVNDVYSNVVGRYFMFGVAFNFGKINAKKQQKCSVCYYADDVLTGSYWIIPFISYLCDAPNGNSA